MKDELELQRSQANVHHRYFPKELSIVKIVSPIKYKRDIINTIEKSVIEPIDVDPRLGVDHIVIEERRNILETNKNDIQSLLNSLNFDLLDLPQKAFKVANDESSTLDFVSTTLATEGEELKGLVEKREALQNKKRELEGLLLILDQFDTLGLSPSLLTMNRALYTHIFVGTLYHQYLKQEKSIVFRIREVTDDNAIFVYERYSDDDSILLLIVLNKDAETVGSILSEVNFQEIKISAIEETVDLRRDTVLGTLDSVNLDIIANNQLLSEFTATKAVKLAAALEIANIELSRIQTELYMRRTETQCVFWGWIPPELKEEFKTNVVNVTDGAAVVDFREGEFDPKLVPSYTPNKPFWQPVRSLVSSFGVPSSEEIDPFGFVRWLFPIFFGIMFADIGHGFILTIIGLIAIQKKRKAKSIPSEGISAYFISGAELLFVMGIAGMIGGLLLGSFFGDETILWQIPALADTLGKTTWKFFYTIEYEHGHPVSLERNYSNFLIFSFGVGAAVILLGLFIQIYQKIYFRHSNAELLGVLSLTGIYVFSLLGIWSNRFFSLAGISLISVFYFEKKAHGIDGAMEALDHVLSLLSNTFSFGRLLAMNTIHFVFALLPYLFLDLFGGFHTQNHHIGAWFENVDIGMWIIGAIIGASIVVPIETVFSTLQALRLNWVEFFGKFYKGEGQEFKPYRVTRSFTAEL